MTDDASFRDDLDRDVGRELVSLARDTVTRCACTDGDPRPTPDAEYDALRANYGAFVTLERGERLRGCIGNVEPDPGDELWEVVRRVAAGAARRDPRCPPVESAELDEITVTVTVLSTPAAVDVDDPTAYPDAVEVGRDGLIVSQGRYEGLLLPQVAVDRDWDAPAFLTATCQKANLPGDAWRRGDVEVERFTARKFAERRPGGDVGVRRFEAARTDDGTRSDGPRTDDGARSDGPRTDDGARSADDNADEGARTGDGSTGTDERATDGGRPAGTGVRQPSVAGEFYAGTEAGLRRQIDECFAHEYGPGPLDEQPGGEPPTALVSPHAGYPFSGPVAAHGFAALAGADPDPDVAVVLGPNHQGAGEAAAVAPHEAWRTPLGELPVDGDFAAALVEESAVATFDAGTHAGEHSVEVQLPFLQYCMDDLSVVPVCLTRLGRERAVQLGRDVAAAVERTARDAVVVSSTDLTHYEPHGRAEAADEPVVDAIRSLDVEGIARAVSDGHTMCGPWATVAGLTTAGELGATDGELLQYATSGQTEGRRDRVVGYCSVAVR
ncbi:MAG: AmmeMemoRadiSam system protein B [Haloarculaceae archaeon]